MGAIRKATLALAATAALASPAAFAGGMIDVFNESETLIQDAMHGLMQGRTTLVIAHRLSTVRGLDRILVFDHGRIVEDGSHADLMRLKGGLYRRLVEHQADRRDAGLAAA